MDFQRIKQHIQSAGDRFVLVEDGEPSLVVMGFREYERLLQNQGINPQAKGFDLVAASSETERRRQWQEEMNAWEVNDLPVISKKRSDHVRLEDLPL